MRMVRTGWMAGRAVARMGLMALVLVACANPGAAPEAVGIAGEAIEVTALDAAPAPEAAAVAAEPAAEAAPEAQVATAETPHPKSRPDTAVAEPASAEPAGAVSEPAVPVEEKSPSQLLCEASDGIWGQAGESGAFTCQKRTKDSGKACTKKTDCQGECLARSNTCAPVSPLFGCNEVLDKEGRMVTLCID
jgi:hypothetical protein